MKKAWLLFMLFALFGASHAAAEEYTYIAGSDTSVHMNQPDTNYGSWTTIDAGEGNGTGSKSVIYCSFDFSELKTDNPEILSPPNPRLGFWYEADITSAVSKKFRNGSRQINIQLVPRIVSNAVINGRFYSRAAKFNKPHLKINLSEDKNEVISAKLYIFGGTSSDKLEVNELKSSFDENTVTYNTKPLCGERIGSAYRNEQLSGGTQTRTVIDTIDGMTYETAMAKTLTNFEAKFPDYTKWDEVYDVANIPSVQQVMDDFKRQCPNGEHPRVLGDKESWERTRRWLKEDNYYVKKWSEYVINTADKSAADFDIPLEFTYNSTGTDMEYRGADLIILGMAYQLTLDKKYADAAYKKMEIMANYSHWNASGKDLNVGDCAKNVGTTYDLVYDALSGEQRSVIVSAVERHVLDTRIGKPNLNTNNWNPVTNGGMGIAALAIMNEQPYKAAQMVVQSVSEIPKSLLEYYPDGAFPEGMSYWEYMTSNLFEFTAAMDSTLGSSYKLCDFKGVSQTGYFLVYMQGPTKKIRFKYGDDKSHQIGSAALFYMAKKFENPDFAEYQFKFMDENNSYSTFAPYWCDDDTFKASGMYGRLQKDRTFDGFTPVSMLRSAWNDPNALYAAIKGGYPQISHADMDTGTFTVAALGEEWSSELYPRIDSRVGFPNQSRMTRFIYYAASPQGHNTLLFNPGKMYPDMEYGQEYGVYTQFEKSYSDENTAFSILDMSETYRKYAEKVRRGIALINNRREFLIQDEIQSSTSNLVYWFMHTDKEIEVNGNTAILKSGSKRLYCKILSPSNAKFEVMQDTALPLTAGIFDYDEMMFGDGKKLAIKTETTGNDKIAVWMVPLTEHDPIPYEEPAVKSLDEWPLTEQDAARLDSVTINGESYKDFSPEKLVYDIVTTDKNFDVEAYGEGVTVNKTVNPDSVIIKCSAAGKKSVRYVFNHITAVDLSEVTIKASDVPQIANSPENTLDSDFDTRWASQGEQWIEYDLGKSGYLDSISVAFYQGSSRMYNFKIEISADGENYKTVFDGTSSGLSDEFEKYEFDKIEAKYVKISCRGSNASNWNNISEVSFGYVNEENE